MVKVTLKSFPKDTNDKVAGIKQIRALYGIGLKEAKEVIENLQAAQSDYTDNTVSDKVKRREAIANLRGMGAVIEVPVDDAGLVEQVRAAAHSALDLGEFDVANDLISILQRVDK